MILSSRVEVYSQQALITGKRHQSVKLMSSHFPGIHDMQYILACLPFSKKSTYMHGQAVTC